MQPNNKRKILLVGGSTAGHILPLLSVYNKLDKSVYVCSYVGSGSAVERKLLADYKIPKKDIFCGKFRRDYSVIAVIKNLFDLLLTLAGIIQSIFLLLSWKPDLIFSKSGFVSVPVSLAAKMLSIPLVIHESDITAGLATKICAKSAHSVFTAFPIAFFPITIKKKTIHTGLPIREEFENQKGLGEDHILITGGSLGALELNDRMLEIMPELLKTNKVVHLTGIKDYQRVLEKSSAFDEKLKANYKAIPFTQNMPELMKKAKLVISRAGATSIFEIAALSKKSLLMPISSGVADHQVDNATFVEQLDMVKVAKAEYSSDKLLKEIIDLIKYKPTNDINNLHFPDSASYIANLLGEFLDYFEFRRKTKNVFMIGIGGVSMKGLAEMLKRMGIRISGSDLKSGGHSRKNINILYDLVVYSSAADEKSQAREEHEKAHRLKIKTLKRSELIGLLMKGFRGVSVSGMHGKTSVSMLIAKLFDRAGLDPSYLIGSPSSETSRSNKLGSGIDFVAEACEYDGSFLDFNSKIAVITNIEKEHLDYFRGGLDQIIDEFTKFVKKISPGGALIYCIDDPNVVKVIKNCAEYLNKNKIESIPYGFSRDSIVTISQYSVKDSIASFKLNQVQFTSNKVGEFFALNCAAMYAVGKFLGLSDDIAIQAVLEFQGAARRFELIGEKNGVLVFDDYGHHPTEIKATIKALNDKFPNKRKILIFEPHQQKRFNDFYQEYFQVFAKNDINVIGILPVYKVPGRDETENKSVSDLIKKINSPNVIELKDYTEAIDFVEENLRNGDILMTMGATDVYKIGRDFLKS